MHKSLAQNESVVKSRNRPLAYLTILDGLPSAFIALIVGLLTLLWLPATLAPEIETSGVLVPANDPTPENACLNEALPPEATIFLLGTNAVWTLERDFTALTIGDCTEVQIKRTGSGLLISANIFASDGNLMAHIQDNKFQLVQNEISYREGPH